MMCLMDCNHFFIPSVEEILANLNHHLIMAESVLIIDDSLYMRTVLNDVLNVAGYKVLATAKNGDEGIDLCGIYRPSIILMDSSLPDVELGTMLHEVNNISPVSKVIIFVSIGLQSVIDEGMNKGVFDYMIKPFTIEGLVSTVNKASGRKHIN